VKTVLILCTGNSCRSIIAEALINAKLKGVKAYSSGVKASGKVNADAKKVLTSHGIWKDSYHSKVLEKVLDIEYDLVVTVCDNAKESCPVFPKKSKVIHVGFKDPDGLEYEAFEKSYKEINDRLLPIVKKELF
jgi:arsenate reductase